METNMAWNVTQTILKLAFCAQIGICVAMETYDDDSLASDDRYTRSTYEDDYYVYPVKPADQHGGNPNLNDALPQHTECVSDDAKRNKLRDKKDTTFLDELLEGYDQRIRPNNNDSPVRVNISIFVNSFYSINEQTMDYKLNIFLRLRWNDPRLAHTSRADAVAIHPSMLERIWKPDLFFSNEKHANFHTVTTENKLLRVYRDGDVSSSVRLTLTLSCAMHLQYFPMDIQICKMELESFGFDMKDLIFDWDGPNAVQLPPQLALPQFLIRGYKLNSCTKLYSTGSFTCVGAQFILQRQMGYYIIQMYAPSLLIVILSWVAFWINMDAAPARTALGITTVLTMTTQSSGARASLPKVSYVKAIDVWFAVCLIFVFAALLEFAVVNFLSRQEKDLFKRQMKGLQAFRRTIRPRRTRKAKDGPPVFPEDAKAAEAREENDAMSIEPCYSMIGRLPEKKPVMERFRWKAKRIDQLSRIVFPLVFVLFNFVYWIAYQVDGEESTMALDGAIMYEP